MEVLKFRNECSESQLEENEKFEVAVLSLMKSLSISESKLDVLRFWIRDMMRRGFDLNNIPHYHKLRNTTPEKMLPPGLNSCETGASINIVSALQHHGGRFLPPARCEGPDSER